MITGNISQGYKGSIKKIINYSGPSVSGLTHYDDDSYSFYSRFIKSVQQKSRPTNVGRLLEKL
jgi:hypothetical protein